jgi:hypothetical protein
MVESERRQIFFSAAIGIPNFYVRRDTGNRFLGKILRHTRRTRPSNRYPGYERVPNDEYRRALVKVLLEDGADLIESLNLRGTMEDLMARLEFPESHGAAGRLTRGILDTVNAKDPMKVGAREFNLGAEKYYRETLRMTHMKEAFRLLEEDCLRLDPLGSNGDESVADALRLTLGSTSAAQFLQKARGEILREQADPETLRRMLELMLISIHQDTKLAAETINGVPHVNDLQPSVH